jgi:hypothetical protein
MGWFLPFLGITAVAAFFMMIFIFVDLERDAWKVFYKVYASALILVYCMYSFFKILF